MSGPSPDLFQRLTQAMCADASHSHCILNTFLALPAAALFFVMIPFVFRWCEADTAEDAAAASDAPLDTHDRSPADRKGAAWKPLAIGEVSTGSGVAARGRQSAPLCIAQAVASLGLALSPALQMVFQTNGDVAGQSVYTGTKAWAIVSFAAWALNGLALFLRAYHALPIPDYQQAWWLLCGAMEVIKLGFIGSGSHTTQTERPYLLLTTVTSLAIMSIMFFPAFYRLMCLRTDDGSCCCTRRVRRAGYSTTANESFEGAGDEEDEAPLAHHADAQLPGFLTAGLFSRALFTWLSPLMRIGYKRALELEDICSLAPADRGVVISKKFNANWNKQLRRKLNTTKPVDAVASVSAALAATCGKQMYSAAMFKLVYDMLAFVGPYLLNAIIKYLQDVQQSHAPVALGFAYVATMFLASVAQTIVLHQYFFRVFRVGMNLRSTVIVAVYQKAIKLSLSARQSRSVGEIVNIMSTDSQRMQDLTTYLQMIWSAPVQIALSLYFLWAQIGVSVMAGVAVMIVFIPFQGFLARKQKNFQSKLMKIKDKRVNLTNETLTGIKLIKYSGWESDFIGRIREIRDLELKQLWAYLVFNAFSTLSWTAVPLLVSLSSFTMYSFMGNNLTASKAFTSLALFNILRFPISMLPTVVSNLVEAKVSINRIKSFLLAAEVDLEATRHLPVLPYRGRKHSEIEIRMSDELDADDSVCALWIRNGSFKYDSDPTPGADSPKGAATGKTQADKQKLLATDEARSSPVGPVLHDVNLSVLPGQLVAVVGQVGSGKSSLVQAILGELHKLSGDVAVRGSVAYIAQTAFIMNATLKENILFGLPFDEERYNTAVDVCCLKPDLAILPAGDETEIGERGINLSGGQRHRVSLARAVYRDADVYLLDDPLSAVDAHVGARIFNEAICGVLRDKTRILVTHGVQYVTHADAVVVMQNGTIAERGTFTELVARPDSLLSAVVATYESEAKDAYDDAKASAEPSAPTGAVKLPTGITITPPASSPSAGDATAKPPTPVNDAAFEVDDGQGESDSDADDADGLGLISVVKVDARSEKDAAEKSAAKFGRTEVLGTGKQTTSESRAKGGVSSSVYGHYATAIGGAITVAIIFFLFVVSSASTAIGNWWLSYWSDSIGAPEQRHSSKWFLAVYAVITLGSLVVTLAMKMYVARAGQRAARLLHENMLTHVVYAYQSFFDTTPLGRILNRFSQDQYLIDESLPDSFSTVFQTFFSVLSTLVVISFVTPLFLVLVVPLVAVYVFTQRYYVSSSRELKRLESVTKSPIYAHFSETLNGTVTIRGYGDQVRFVQANAEKLDTNQASYFLGTIANRWLAVRLELIGAVMVTGASLFAIIYRDTISPSLAGLSISYALSVTQTLNWFVRVTAEVESKIVAVERLREFSVLPTEPIKTFDQAPTVAPNWPSQGRIVLRNLKLKYRHETPYVLHGVSASIAPHEKIGICGRTGAGKSSLISALYRLADVQEGDVLIDGVNINDVSLSELRSRLAIIPQEPTLFSGTLRKNLDPLEKSTDEDVWAALDMVSLKSVIQRKPEQLDAPVTEGGENWSHGQRQLICMARALLKRCKVVILDEATAACDVETDAILQRTIRKAFAQSTVLTIAHRVHTILDSDRIMVLEQGRVAEFDQPKRLLANPASHFSRLLAESASASEHVGSAPAAHA